MGMTDLYSPILLDHNANPDYRYTIAHATHSHDGVNPTCGDELTIQIRMGDDGRIAEASFTGHGCAVSQASADMMCDAVIGQTAEDALALCKLFERMLRSEETDDAVLEQLGDAASLKDISHMPSRVKCAELAWRTLDEILSGRAQESGVTSTE